MKQNINWEQYTDFDNIRRKLEVMCIWHPEECNIGVMIDILEKKNIDWKSILNKTDSEGLCDALWEEVLKVL